MFCSSYFAILHITSAKKHNIIKRIEDGDPLQSKEVHGVNTVGGFSQDITDNGTGFILTVCFG